jgi:peptidoglycan/LPS O-acetylase OafA/YrhL
MLEKLKTHLFGFFSTTTRNQNLDFLDGYRGFLCITVIANHLFGDAYTVFGGTGLRVGVFGFFVLSAFLLTFRLLIEFEKALSSSSSLWFSSFKVVLITVQYGIRRLFRVYLPFLIFYKFFMPHNQFRSAVSVLTYRDTSHLWTIPVEIKFYFFIPLISLASAITARFWVLFISILATFIFVVEFYNPFNLTYVSYHRNWRLAEYLTLFLKGSLTAIVYYHVKKNEHLMRTITNVKLQKLLYFVTWLAIIFMLRNGPSGWQNTLPLPNPHFIYAEYAAFVVLLLMVFGEPNYITNLFNDNYALRSFGKYSFGIYLLHQELIKLYRAKFAIHTGPILGPFLSLLILSYISGFLWFYCIENPLVKLANYMCLKLAILLSFDLNNSKKIPNSKQAEPLLIIS